MAKTLEQIIQGLNERHLTGDASAVLAYAQAQSEVLAQAERTIADAQQEVEILRLKLNYAEKLFDAAQARLGDKALGQAEVMAVLGVPLTPETSVPAVQTFALPVEALAKCACGCGSDTSTPAADAPGALVFRRECLEATAAPVETAPAPDVHPFVAQTAAAQSAAKAQGEAVLYGDASAPSEAIGLHALDALSMQAQPDIAAVQTESTDPTTPPSAPVGDAK